MPKWPGRWQTHGPWAAGQAGQRVKLHSAPIACSGLPWLLFYKPKNELDCKEIQPVHPKGDQSWVFIRRTDSEAETPNTLATRCEELTHQKRPWCWERQKAKGEGDDRGWDGWMASSTQWTWVWASSRRWWRTGKPGLLQSMGSQSWTRLRDSTTITRKRSSTTIWLGYHIDMKVWI